jgi:hypothetical protein
MVSKRTFAPARSRAKALSTSETVSFKTQFDCGVLVDDSVFRMAAKNRDNHADFVCEETYPDLTFTSSRRSRCLKKCDVLNRPSGQNGCVLGISCKYALKRLFYCCFGLLLFGY